MWIYRGDVTFSVEATGVSILRMAKNILFWLGLTSNFSHFSISVISTPKCLHLCKHFGSDIEMVDQIFRTIFKRGIIWQDDSFCAAFIFSDVVVSPGLYVLGSISLGKEMLPGEKLPGLGFGDASEIIQLWALCSLSPTPEIWLVPLHRGAKAPPSELLLQLSPLSFSWVSLEERGCDCKIWRQAAKKSIWWRDTTNQVLFPLSPEKVSENQ